MSITDIESAITHLLEQADGHISSANEALIENWEAGDLMEDAIDEAIATLPQSANFAQRRLRVLRFLLTTQINKAEPFAIDLDKVKQTIQDTLAMPQPAGS
ncbi:MAG: hypothetical protein ABW168_00235 [Sedimenticola sp.]